MTFEEYAKNHNKRLAFFTPNHKSNELILGKYTDWLFESGDDYEKEGLIALWSKESIVASGGGYLPDHFELVLVTDVNFEKENAMCIKKAIEEAKDKIPEYFV